jgi:glyoxylase-like metal-dependent hydrolase (beta-lactamase superfamily II)
LGIQPAQIGLIAITHAHYDHVGSLAAIRSRCQCPVAAHAQEALLIASGRVVIPPGTNRLTRPLCRWADRHRTLLQRLNGFEPLVPEVTFSSAISLQPYGFDARILPTPGHTAGSITVLTAAGDAFVGDLAFNIPGLAHLSPLPPFGDNPAVMRHSWRQLRQAGARRIYPGHGAPFRAELLR